MYWIKSYKSFSKISFRLDQNGNKFRCDFNITYFDTSKTLLVESQYIPIEHILLVRHKRNRCAKKDIEKLAEEKNSYNPMDQFAKYTLVERKIIPLNDKIQDIKSKIRSDRMKKAMYLKFSFTAIIIILSIILIWNNYEKPIIDFNGLLRKSYTNDDSSISDNNHQLSMFFPLNRFLSFPCKNQMNSIGVTAWLFIVNRTIDIITNKISSSVIKIDKSE